MGLCLDCSVAVEVCSSYFKPAFPHTLSNKHVCEWERGGASWTIVYVFQKHTNIPETMYFKLIDFKKSLKWHINAWCTILTESLIIIRSKDRTVVKGYDSSPTMHAISTCFCKLSKNAGLCNSLCSTVTLCFLTKSPVKRSDLPECELWEWTFYASASNQSITIRSQQDSGRSLLRASWNRLSAQELDIKENGALMFDMKQHNSVRCVNLRDCSVAPAW